MAVTRKLRQVEQAIRSGGVLILCHAEQLFESLYMVLNQQYWAQDDVMMTQIALGPSSRAIVLLDGPFRIIALQVHYLFFLDKNDNSYIIYLLLICRILIRHSILMRCPLLFSCVLRNTN